jgi:hypothetical protein
MNETPTIDNIQIDDLATDTEQHNLSPSNAILGEYLIGEEELLHIKMKLNSLKTLNLSLDSSVIMVNLPSPTQPFIPSSVHINMATSPITTSENDQEYYSMEQQTGIIIF